MSETTITQLSNPSGFGSGPFTDVLRDGARKLIEQAIDAEFVAGPGRCATSAPSLRWAWQQVVDAALRFLRRR